MNVITKEGLEKIKKSWLTGKRVSGAKGKHWHISEKSKERFMKENNHNWKGGVTKNKKYRTEYSKKYNKLYIKTHKEIRLIHNQKRRFLKNNTGGKFSLEQWIKLKEKYNFTCPCCNKSEPEIKLTIDHIKPLSKGGNNDIENIQPLCMKCNRKKYTKTIKYTYYRLIQGQLSLL